MIDATRFRELWEAYCTHSANLKSAEEAGTELETDYIDEKEARQLLGSFLFSHAAELLAENERLIRIETAARNYFVLYCQDEAADDGPEMTGCGQSQHESAKMLRAALNQEPGQ
jgi:hypothetical protein